MTHRVITTRRAAADVRSAVDYDVAAGAADAAERFINAMATARSVMSEYPSLGSARAEVVTGFAGVRSLAVQGFPHVVYYIDEGTTVRVLRVLHTSHDVARALD